MQLGTQEHIDMMAAFEKSAARILIRGRFDKELKSEWPKGHIYQDGHVNEHFKFYCAGYSHARCVYLNQ